MNVGKSTESKPHTARVEVLMACRGHGTAGETTRYPAKDCWGVSTSLRVESRTLEVPASNTQKVTYCIRNTQSNQGFETFA